MRRVLAVSILALVASSAALAQGGQAMGIAIDAGAALPLGAFARDGATSGLTMGATATLRVTSSIGVYASLERTMIPVSRSAPAPGDGSWTDQGVGAGVRLWLPQREDRRLRPWAQLGLALHDLDQPIAGTEFARIDTKGLVTVEGGAGLDIALEARRIWFLRPIVRYRRYAFEVETPSATARSQSSFLTLGVGLVMAFGAGNPTR